MSLRYEGITDLTRPLHLVGTWYFTSAYNCNIILNINHLTRLFTNNSCYHKGFFAVKRRTVFILGAMWIALVRGWRRDCVVGGMETRFQWRKTHSRTAKCEAFHFAPRLFFMFLFLIPFTIRQHCIIYAPSNFPLGQNTSPQKSKKSALAEGKCASCEGCVYIKMERRLNQAPQSRRIEWGCFVESPSLPYLCVLDMVP